jgi:FMN phosphatase YigB (HAD superfamily)
MAKRKAAIFDVDGTLANVDPYLHNIRNINNDPEFKKNYDKFHEESIGAEPNQEAIDYLRDAMENGLDIVVVTSRREWWRGVTSIWMAKNGIYHDALYMRKDGDFRKDYEVKDDILYRINKQWDVMHAFDDNPAVIELWEKNGIPTTKIGDWDGSR